jgi:hypothetical protein
MEWIRLARLDARGSQTVCEKSVDKKLAFLGIHCKIFSPLVL